MRNESAITAINSNLVAALRSAGADVTPLTLEELEVSTRPGQWQTGVFRYSNAAAHARRALTPRATQTPKAPDSLPEITPEDEAFINGEDFDFEDVLTSFELFVQASAKPDPDEETLAEEDSNLSRIPIRFREPRADGNPLSRSEINQAEEDVEAAFAAPAEEPSPLRREMTERFVHRVALRYVPNDFTPHGEGERAEAERFLAGWAALRDRRDQLVRHALSVGVTKSRVHELTGLSRSTIDRIPGI